MTSPFRKGALALLFLLAVHAGCHAQHRVAADSLSKLEPARRERPKVAHAEPLYIDLIRDLGARKGEREWNVGLGLTDNLDYDAYTALVEYEFAPIDRLGLEVELPFTFYGRQQPRPHRDSLPAASLNSFKLAAQYTFLVSERHRTSMAAGYIHELELPEFRRYGKEPLVAGHVYNPFVVLARQWPNQLHSLLYAGPRIAHHPGGLHTSWQVNTSVHYLIPQTRNFVGIEFNKELQRGDFDMTIRPQLRVSITDNMLIGIVAGVPIRRERERFSTFLRLIYEPRHRQG